MNSSRASAPPERVSSTAEGLQKLYKLLEIV